MAWIQIKDYSNTRTKIKLPDVIKRNGINLSKLISFDKENNTQTAINLRNSLEIITGLCLEINDNENLNYKDEKSDYRGSDIARQDLKQVIDNKLNKRPLSVEGSLTGSGGPPIKGGYYLKIDPFQIQNFIDNSVNVNNETLGYGMAFLHELHHTALGIEEPHHEELHEFGKTGYVVDRMNKIRQQLGVDYGIRSSYIPTWPILINKKLMCFFPFNKLTLDKLKNENKLPNNDAMYIEQDYKY